MAANQFGTAAAYAYGWVNGTPFSYWENQVLDGGNCSQPLIPVVKIQNNTVVIDGGTASSLPVDMIPSRGAL